MLPDVLALALTNHYEGDLSGYTSTYLQGRLNEVVDKIQSRWGSIVQARLDSGTLPQRLYEAVVCRVAARVLRNPEGYRSEQEGSYNYHLNPAVASGTLWFTDDDEADLTGSHPRGPGIVGTFTIGRHQPGFV